MHLCRLVSGLVSNFLVWALLFARNVSQLVCLSILNRISGSFSRNRTYELYVFDQEISRLILPQTRVSPLVPLQSNVHFAK